MKRSMIIILLLTLIILVNQSNTIDPNIAHNLTLNSMSLGPGFSWAQSTFGEGGGTPSVTIAGHTYTWVTILMMVVTFFAITFTTVLCTFNVHRYYLRKGLNFIDARPYLNITKASLLVYFITLLLAYIFIFSLWYVLLIGVTTQILGLLGYWLRNYIEGNPIKYKEITRAYMISSFSSVMILLLFL